MPVTVSYPGVYVEEIPSGNFTITGVATSITAFVGRTMMGPTDPIDCFSYAEFEQHFGGRSYEYPLSYAVEDFFQNGGGHAIIVRVLPGDAAPSKTADNSPLKLTAASPGSWANGLTASIDRKNITPAVAEQYERYGVGDPTKIETARKAIADAAGKDAAARKAAIDGAKDAVTDLFNLTLTYTKPDGQKTVQYFPNVTLVKNAPNRIDRVLAAEKHKLAVVPPDTFQGSSALTAPAETTTPIAFTGGDDKIDEKLGVDDYVGDDAQLKRTGLYALDHVDLFNLLCIPWDKRGEDLPEGVYQKAAEYCVKRRAMLILDPRKEWNDLAQAGEFSQIQPTDFNISGPDVPARNCAVYFPRVKKADSEMDGFVDIFPACGIIAGVMATTDVQRGVWKAPAGITAGLGGIDGLEMNLTDDQNGMLNQIGINCLRNFPVIGPIVWGARTLRGADLLSDDYKYVPVRRLTLFIEESLYRGTKFAVFEPNDETLWSHLRLSIGTFMADLARQGAFYGYAVACDKTTTTQYDIDRGIVNIRVAFAPVKPAEFVVLQIQQQAGQTAQ